MNTFNFVFRHCISQKVGNFKVCEENTPYQQEIFPSHTYVAERFPGKPVAMRKEMHITITPVNFQEYFKEKDFGEKKYIEILN